jgi:hypothetical protein
MNARLLDRRAFLRSASVLLALPAWESLSPRRVSAAPDVRLPGTNADGTPLRMAYLYLPNGVIGDAWKPLGEGRDFRLNSSMEPLEPFRDALSIVSGLEHKNGWALADGGGDHARACATILTGARPKKTAGSDIRLGISVDQVAAQKMEGLTRFASLELTCDAQRGSGSCDSGYSCAYQYNLSWRSATQPVIPECNPRELFERLFGAGNPADRAAASEKVQARERSILDFVLEDARRLQKQIGRQDQSKLEEYLTGVREIEKRIQNAAKFGPPPAVDAPAPEGIPASYSEHMKLFFDILTLAFQSDSTRIATFLLAHDGSNRNFPEIGVSDGHHQLSHHQKDPQKIAQLQRIDRFYMEHAAYFLAKLRDTRDANGKSLLDSSMVVCCAGLSDANRHAHDNLPLLLAGRAGGALQPGTHLQLPSSQPMTNLYRSLLDRFGTPVERIGDSDGLLSGI